MLSEKSREGHLVLAHIEIEENSFDSLLSFQSMIQQKSKNVKFFFASLRKISSINLMVLRPPLPGPLFGAHVQGDYKGIQRERRPCRSLPYFGQAR